jgi:hypothetical protein
VSEWRPGFMSVEVFTTVALFEEGKWARLDDLLARRKLRWQRLSSQ